MDGRVAVLEGYRGTRREVETALSVLPRSVGENSETFVCSTAATSLVG